MEAAPEPEVAHTTANNEAPKAAPAQTLSKNAQKRLAKAASLAEKKKERRAHEKEKRKKKKRQRAEQKPAGELDEEEEARQKKKARIVPKKPFNARIVIDLGFDELMSENEIKSLTSQLAYTYSANRKAVQPFSSLLFTSLNGRTYTRLETISDAAYRRWHNSEWWSESYERLWEGPPASAGESSTSGEAQPTNEGTNKANGDQLEKTPESQAVPRESIVYLTADSADELTELREDETYIIGGLCDHNRYKNLCFKKSQTTGIRSARLPIGTYLSELKTRKVLTVNQTFEILLKWVETRDWEQALYSVVPKRKFQDIAGSTAKTPEAATTDGVSVKQMVVDAAELEDEDNEGVDSGDEAGIAIAAPLEPMTSSENGPAIVMDPDDNKEVPP